MYSRKVSRSTSSMLSSFFCVSIHWKTSDSSAKSPWESQSSIKRCNRSLRAAQIY
jgi:hypothetical protein